VVQILVFEIEWLVIIIDFRHVGIGEDIGQHPPFAADPRLDFTAGLAPPSPIPAILIFPVLGVADAGLGLDIVEPRVLDAFTAGPNVLASDRTGVAADALVEIQYFANLGANFHSAASL
jgi:hypothetical protein